MTKDISTPIKVLFIDDDFEDLELFQDALQQFDDTAMLTWLRDARKVKEYLVHSESFPYNIILLDIKMPLMDGITCLQMIRQIPELNLIPIVMYSTFKFDEDVETCFASGANMYVQKPTIFNLYQKMLQEIFCNDWRTKLLTSKYKKVLSEM